MDKKYKIIMPLFNDWESLRMLIRQIHEEIKDEALKKAISILVINDYSTEKFSGEKLNEFFEVEIVDLVRNLGHQKAICIGLAYLNASGYTGDVIVMDSDGEDKASDIPKLIEQSNQAPGKIVFAYRRKRQESVTFKFFYFFYKMAFYLLTGKPIKFGNFCIIPNNVLNNVAHISEIWNHFSGGIIRSKIPYTTIPLDRGKRLAGESKMNFVALLIHGLSAVSVHIDTVAVRLLIASVFFIAFSLLGIFVIIIVKFTGTFDIPGWPSSVFTSLLNIFLQAFIISLFLVFLVLNHRTQLQFIPAKDYKDFIQKTTIG